jgi:site-specific DNA-methyltransferase (adenine-specific)
LHPTQKPVALYEYLTRTYTNEGDTVLDFTMGSGTTGVACVQTGRKFIGVEIDPTYFEIAVKRIKEAQLQTRMEI